MSVFQFIVNLVIAVVACVVINVLFGYVAIPLEGLVILLLCLVAVFMTFSQNAAAKLGVS